MHILAALVAVLGVLAIVLWRMSQAANAARDIAGAAEEAHSFWRRLMLRRKAGKHPLDSIQDPREAAAAMMVAIAQWDGALTEREEAAIREEMQAHFEVGEPEAGELVARGRWLAEDVGDLGTFLKRASHPVQARCTAAEKRDLIEMLTRVADVGGRPDELIEQEITRLAEHLAR
jgi:uncharacterized tellurite resistance protein B-like protein